MNGNMTYLIYHKCLIAFTFKKKLKSQMLITDYIEKGESPAYNNLEAHWSSIVWSFLSLLIKYL